MIYRRIVCGVPCAARVDFAHVHCYSPVSLYCCVSCALQFAAYRACSCISLHIESAAMWIGWLCIHCAMPRMCCTMLHAGFAADRSDVIIWNHKVSQHQVEPPCSTQCHGRAPYPPLIDAGQTGNTTRNTQLAFESIVKRNLVLMHVHMVHVVFVTQLCTCTCNDKLTTESLIHIEAQKMTWTMI